MILTEPWFEQWPDRLKRELAELETEGVAHTIDEELRSKGILRIHLEFPLGDGTISLDVTYPDLYPYFRFEVQANETELKYHQNPFGKNLCLIGQATDSWAITDTVYSLLESQLPRVINYGNSHEINTDSSLEEQQAEPVSVFYHYAPSMVLIDSSWKIPQNCQGGKLVIGVDESPASRIKDVPVFRGAVLQVWNSDISVVESINSAIMDRYTKPIEGRWIRLTAPILEADAESFIRAASTSHERLMRCSPKYWEGTQLKVWGFVFPDAVEGRQTADSWIFIFEQTGPSIAKPQNRTLKPKRRIR